MEAVTLEATKRHNELLLGIWALLHFAIAS